ncbi:basic salivary proline-rich protein 2-like [Heteronotia binoei]|uniref:basic salivary proline-rich protein 2-like n=1 Tax=Heteronotia binoei TaxID=13085 RepID=UPI00292EC080|nr:basic salivary proline-rich protein 2-like [Heteronotia binoei]
MAKSSQAIFRAPPPRPGPWSRRQRREGREPPRPSSSRDSPAGRQAQRARCARWQRVPQECGAGTSQPPSCPGNAQRQQGGKEAGGGAEPGCAPPRQPCKAVVKAQRPPPRCGRGQGHSGAGEAPPALRDAMVWPAPPPATRWSGPRWPVWSPPLRDGLPRRGLPSSSSDNGVPACPARRARPSLLLRGRGALAWPGLTCRRHLRAILRAAAAAAPPPTALPEAPPPPGPRMQEGKGSGRGLRGERREEPHTSSSARRRHLRRSAHAPSTAHAPQGPGGKLPRRLRGTAEGGVSRSTSASGNPSSPPPPEASQWPPWRGTRARRPCRFWGSPDWEALPFAAHVPVGAAPPSCGSSRTLRASQGTGQPFP